jgi:hypothetical protein
VIEKYEQWQRIPGWSDIHPDLALCSQAAADIRLVGPWKIRIHLAEVGERRMRLAGEAAGHIHLVWVEGSDCSHLADK